MGLLGWVVAHEAEVIINSVRSRYKLLQLQGPNVGFETRLAQYSLSPKAVNLS